MLTPNLAEAALLLGVASDRPRLDRRGGAAASAARSLGGAGQGRPPRRRSGRRPGDRLGVELLAEPRIAGEMRGTGCTLAMALACELARGAELAMPCVAARTYVRAKLAAH